MNWLQKYKALRNLDDCNLKIRASIDDVNGTIQYHASFDSLIEIGGDGCLSSPIEDGSSVRKAIEALWKQVTTLKEPYYLVKRTNNVRRHFRWDGLMWKEIERNNGVIV